MNYKTEEYRARKRKWRVEHVLRMRELRARWRTKNKRHISEYNKAYRAKNALRIREYEKAYRVNPAHAGTRLTPRSVRTREEMVERTRAYDRERYKRNRDRNGHKYRDRALKYYRLQRQQPGFLLKRLERRIVDLPDDVKAMRRLLYELRVWMKANGAAFPNGF